MSDGIRERMLGLLESDDPVLRRHAHARLAMLDGTMTPPSPSPVHDAPPDEWAARIRACPDHNPGCCASPLPYCTRHAIHPTRDQCVACLSEPA